MALTNEYHGQEIQPGRRAQNVPPMPSGRRGHLPDVIFHGHPIAGIDASYLRRLREAGPPDPNRTYAHVRLVGNYNLGCIDTQTLDYYNISPDDAHRYAWEAFGFCVHLIAYFDENERLVAGE